jgi:K+ transporter
MRVTAKIDTASPAAAARDWAPAALACMGVVFGDIGTSPLYTLQVGTKAASPSGTASPEAVLGIVSLIFWWLIIVISIKSQMTEASRRGNLPTSSLRRSASGQPRYGNPGSKSIDTLSFVG